MGQLATWTSGAAVYDTRSQMVGFVDRQQGHMVRIKRPSGLSWTAYNVGVREATDREKIQLRALAEHHRKATSLARLSRYLGRGGR